MSQINDEQGNAIVTMGTLNAMAFKVLIWIGIIATPAAFVMFWNHDKRLDLHEWRITSLERQNSHGSSMTNSVNVGAASTEETLEASARTWLTTREVAEREGCDERTVINYIAAGQIEPAPVKVGKSWQIAEHFRIVPKEAESGGTVANAKLKPEEAKP